MNWKLVKDDASHWHYEGVPKGCCEFYNEQRICMDCEEQPRWHASMWCPICRGPGKEFTE